nr:hypothetical protein GCM10020093_047190 [Planobispora longispora]
MPARAVRAGGRSRAVAITARDNTAPMMKASRMPPRLASASVAPSDFRASVRALITVITSAVPKAAATCCSVLRIELPWE